MAQAMKKKTTSTRRKTTSKKVETKPVEITEEVIEASEEKVEISKTPKKVEPKVEVVEKKEFKPTDTIPCKSLVVGSLFMVGSKTNNLYKWADNGDIEEVEYQDLVYDVRAAGGKSFSLAPKFAILDDDFVSEFPKLGPVYDKIYNVNDLSEILTFPERKLQEAVSGLPKTAKDALKCLALEKIENGELDSLSVVKTLDSILGTQLYLLANN